MIHDASARLFIRGLSNLKGELIKAEEHAAASGRGGAALLNARLADAGHEAGVPSAANDLHGYTLAAHVHWAAEAARLAVAYLLGAQPTPDRSPAASFAGLHRSLDATIAYVREVAPGDLEAGVDRTIVIERPRGAVRSDGARFLLAFAIPHFFYHLATAHGIMRNEGVRLTMGDFLGDWGSS